MITMPETTTPLTVLGIGQNGILLTDGVNLYKVWESTSSAEGYEWYGMKVRTVTDAFEAFVPDLCGAEIDMRQNDDDAMTPEIMDLNDRVAVTLNEYLKKPEAEITAKWEAVKKANGGTK